MRPIPKDTPSSEEWMPVISFDGLFEGLYDISRCGQVYSIVRGIILKPGINMRGYLQVNLQNGGIIKRVTVHMLVMESFVGPCPHGYDINHKDGNKLNNALSNIEYATRSKNHRHAFANGLKNQTGSLNNNTTLNETKVKDIRKRAEDGETQQSIADDYGLSRSTIGLIVSRVNWGHVV